MTADELLNTLEQRELVTPAVIASLRRQVAQSAKPIVPAAIVKLLIDKQELTPAQGQKLLAAAASAPQPAIRSSAAPAPAASAAALEEELGLAPEQPAGSEQAEKPRPAPKAPAKAAPAAVADEADDLGLAPEPASPAAKTPAAVAQKPAAQPAPAATSSAAADLLDDELGLAVDKPTAAAVAAPAVAPKKSSAGTSTGNGAAGKSSAQNAGKQPAARSQPGANSPAAAKPQPSAKSQTNAKSQPASQTQPTAKDEKSTSAASDMGLDEDLFAELGDSLSLPDENLLTAAAASEMPAGLPSADPLGSAIGEAAPETTVGAAPAAASRRRITLKLIGGILAAVAAAGAVATVVLTRGTGEPEFQKAEQEYNSQNWAEAVTRYNELLRDYPSLPQGGKAHVHRGFAQLSSQLAGARPDWPQVLATAEAVLPEIQRESQYVEVEPELVSILTDMCEGLTQAAEQATDPADAERRVGLARKALALAQNPLCIAPAHRPWQKLVAIEDRVGVRAREVGRAATLADAIEKIKQAAGQPDASGLVSAFDARDRLIERYPELAASDPLRAAMQNVAEAEAARVTPQDTPTAPAVSTPPPTAVTAACAIVARRIPAAGPGKLATGPPALVLVGGALYAVDGGNGRVLWRRYLGDATAGSWLMLPGKEGAADALVFDTRHQELLRLEAATGKRKWGQSLGQSLAGPPLVMGDKAYLALVGGGLAKLDLGGGEIVKSVGWPGAPAIGPTSSADGQPVLQTTDHGTLLALLPGDLKCARSFYLDAHRGRLEFAPVASRQMIVVAENSGLNDGALRLIGADAQGLPSESLGQVGLAARIACRPVVVGQNLFVVDGQGGLHAWEITDRAGTPLKAVLEERGRSQKSGDWFAVAAGKQLWVAGCGLRRYDLQPVRAREGDQWFADDWFDQPPVAAGDIMVCAHRPAGHQGTLVSGIDPQGQVRWEIELGSLLADGLTADAKSTQLSVLATDGGQTVLSGLDKTWQAIEHAPVTAAAPGQPIAEFRGVLRLKSGKRAGWTQSTGAAWSIIDEKNVVGSPLSLPELPAAPPSELAAGLLLATSEGGLLLCDPATGKPMTASLRWQIQAGRQAVWTSPAATGDGKKVLIGDEHPRLVAVGFSNKPLPQLIKLQSVDLPTAILAGPIATDDYVYLVTDEGLLRAFDLATLKPAGEWRLAGKHVSWLERAGNWVLVGVGEGELHGCDAKQQLFWHAPFEAGAPVGRPLPTDKGVLIATRAGKIVRLEGATGKPLAQVDLEQPIDGGLVEIGARVAALAPDGCLLQTAKP